MHRYANPTPDRAGGNTIGASPCWQTWNCSASWQLWGRCGTQGDEPASDGTTQLHASDGTYAGCVAATGPTQNCNCHNGYTNCDCNCNFVGLSCECNEKSTVNQIKCNNDNKCRGPNFQKYKGCVPSTGPTQAAIHAGCGCNNGYTNCECNSGRCNDGSIECNRASICKDCSGRDGEYGCDCAGTADDGICNDGAVCSGRDMRLLGGSDAGHWVIPTLSHHNYRCAVHGDWPAHITIEILNSCALQHSRHTNSFNKEDFMFSQFLQFVKTEFICELSEMHWCIGDACIHSVITHKLNPLLVITWWDSFRLPAVRFSKFQDGAL